MQGELDFTPYQADPEERPRLNAQNREILRLLKEGPTSNKTLAQVALSYTRRISDLRELGFNIQIQSRDRKTGLVIYTLKED